MIDDRFQVLCVGPETSEEQCGNVETYRNKEAAFRMAKRHAEHPRCPNVIVFDGMARVGFPETWTWKGKVIQNR